MITVGEPRTLSSAHMRFHLKYNIYTSVQLCHPQNDKRKQAFYCMSVTNTPTAADHTTLYNSWLQLLMSV